MGDISSLLLLNPVNELLRFRFEDLFTIYTYRHTANNVVQHC